jgi:Flp pilus assembly protein TadD
MPSVDGQRRKRAIGRRCDFGQNTLRLTTGRRPAGEAEASYREALRLRPNYPEAHNNLGNALYSVGRPAEAEPSYREAVRLKPDFADAHYNLGQALLSTGQLEEGWKECEWR